MDRKVTPLLSASLGLILASITGAASAKNPNWDVTGSAVFIHQTATKSDAQSESTASGDLYVEHTADAGKWLVHLEASTTPKAQGVSALYPESNGDAGSALDGNSNGRFQLSELYYTRTLVKNQEISAGLIDISGLFEQSSIASDEGIDFIASPFTANPTIEFPDYTLGVVYKAQLADKLTFRSALASSNGLADNPQRSYSQLLTLASDNKGVFGIVSASWRHQGWLVRAGTWINTADHQRLDMTANNEKNYGGYLLAEHKRGRHTANFRIGAANSDTSRGATFTSLNYQYEWDKLTVGASAGRTFLSAKEPDNRLSDTDHYEVFLRYTLKQGLLLTGNAQHIIDSNFGDRTNNHNGTIFGVRLTWLYD
ncbi:MAG: carbohydrate porin [Idiomarina sp.]